MPTKIELRPIDANSVEVCGRAGSQLSSGGFARLTLRVERVGEDLRLVDEVGVNEDWVWTAISDGVRDAVSESPETALKVTLVDVYVDPVDARDLAFTVAAKAAVLDALSHLKNLSQS